VKNLSVIIFSFFSLIIAISAMNYEINTSSPNCVPFKGKGFNSCCSIDMKSTHNKSCEKNCCLK